eukprot:scaffold24916_cov63-Phaeocystis_antarctica.AAC.2
MPRAAHLGGRSWVGRHRQAERLGHLLRGRVLHRHTERRCVVNAMNVRADHVVSSYSDAVSLLARHSAPLRSSSPAYRRSGKPSVQKRSKASSSSDVLIARASFSASKQHTKHETTTHVGSFFSSASFMARMVASSRHAPQRASRAP